MKRFSVNLSTIYTEVPFLQRFQKAKAAGFSYVECQFPYEYSIEQIKKVLEQNQLELVLINLPPGDWQRGDRGLAVDPNRVSEFQESVDIGIAYAKELQVKMIHCMAGIVEKNNKDSKETYIQNVRYAAKRLAEQDITLLIEPINSFDMPNYFLSDLHNAAEILKIIALPNVKLQYDFYHIQRIHGNLLANFHKYIQEIGHIQIADTPGRHEPGTGEIHYENIFKAIGNSNYKGLIGLEYSPKGKSEDSFHWLSSSKKGEI